MDFSFFITLIFLGFINVGFYIVFFIFIFNFHKA
ncbi:hypothetical protein PEC301879_36360 [Pectobacterium carotovorum subsp. carotovorum]|nr:hypothetical protein PEC301879_36360 [Pectobacterium carotovorum subsp. carotovorum]